MNVFDREVTYKATFVEIDGKEYSLGAIERVLEELEETSFGASHVIIHDDEIESLFVEQGVVIVSVRGSVARSKNYDAFKGAIEKAANEFYKSKPCKP